ncbi:RagB/SusD family nutrient uptake outer membrane protein [Pseudobacter ginsenosidimutans]|uniref:Putative outer membrane starch-binding protein n=1 Tax=Pseudobacter ginsenosidimutans TaxID=661488 RepID=A0A4Q7N359_9BACT|nr:RagB/SusD family nutrient uptake outer membrane protein [Pseudobacter ginsenosidimutans]QEC43468.1 RagB/SusD family nutrient uptake outer membrane protein [Pseudobacter ginsenosidimutans]RZS74855.1 putative outer membrane starch-binding protein [Pseudobacter ginsenosidimutans]
MKHIILHKRYLLKAVGYALLLTTLSGCNKILQVDLPADRIQADKVFEDEISADAAVNGIYARQVGRISDNTYYYMLTGGMTMWGGWSSDELKYSGTNIFFPLVEANKLDPEYNTIYQAIWMPAYSDIYHINAAIEGLLGSQRIGNTLKKQLLGECYFLRAFYYFYLTQLFGDLPLIDHTNYNTNGSLGRTPARLIIQFIDDDLKKAHENSSTEKINGKLARVNRSIVEAFMARFYLCNEQWDKAYYYSGNSMTNSFFSLEEDHNRIFKRQSRETIWYFDNTRNYSIVTGEGYTFGVPGFISSYMRNEMIDAFDTTVDIRWKKWVLRKKVGDKEYCVPYKYKQASIDVSLKDEDYVVLRLAEQYLIHAEASIHLEKTEDALAGIDSVRRRAGLDLLSLRAPRPVDKKALQQLLEDEKRREFFCEWGHRWFDLKRWPGYTNPGVKRADEVLSVIKPGWKSSAMLFPIPESERMLNPNLSQNEGYPQ